MKKTVLALSINLLFAGTYSDTISDEQLKFYLQIDTEVEKNANESIKQIDTMRQNIIENIVKNDELKKDYLTKIKKLGTEELLYFYEFDFEINRYLNLQNIEIQTEPVKDNQ